jgi:DNA-binding response OmpR family regulator
LNALSDIDVDVLVIEDDEVTRRYTVASLAKAGYKVMEAASGEEGLSIAKEQKPTVIVLDIMLPGIDGFEICAKLHASEIDSIIIMLTAKSEDVDKIRGLELGADDYMVKPFNPIELIARIKAILRRWLRAHQYKDAHEFMDIRIDFRNLKTYKGDVELGLTPREITLLGLFMQNKGKLLSRDDLYKSIYGEAHFGTNKVIDVYVKRLREKIENNPHEPSIIRTVWGKGYVCGAYDEDAAPN